MKQPKVSNIDSKSCDLSWMEPEDNGGTPITGYHVEMKRLKELDWIRMNKTPISQNSYHVPDLIIQEKYRFRITAQNKKGEGKTGQESEEVEAVGKYWIFVFDLIPFYLRFATTDSHTTYKVTQEKKIQSPIYPGISKVFY